MADWLNHATIAAPKNGTSTHTVGPDGTGGTVVAGSAFTPTAGRLLVVFVEGAVTSTTPSGWTLPTNGSAINNSALYVWHRTAAGSDTLTTTHNASDYAAVFDFYEFALGSTFVGVASTINVSASGGAGPTLSGLTGTNWTAGVMGQANANVGTDSITWDLGTEAADVSVAQNVTDGYNYGLTYTDDDTATSAAYAATCSDTGNSVERLVVAVNAASGAPPNVVVQLIKPI